MTRKCSEGKDVCRPCPSFLLLPLQPLLQGGSRRSALTWEPTSRVAVRRSPSCSQAACRGHAPRSPLLCPEQGPCLLLGLLFIGLGVHLPKKHNNRRYVWRFGLFGPNQALLPVARRAAPCNHCTGLSANALSPHCLVVQDVVEDNCRALTGYPSTQARGSFSLPGRHDLPIP